VGSKEFVGTIEEVETHGNDPIDPGADESTIDPWDRLGEQFTSLGGKLRDRYQAVAGPEGPSLDEVKAALTTLGGAMDRVVEALSVAVKDDQVRTSLKQTAATFAEAMGAALSEVPAFLRRQPTEAPDPADKAESGNG
jgi:hypothetical protein